MPDLAGRPDGTPARRFARPVYAALSVGIVAAGLVWRLAPLGLPPFLLKYGGSVL